MKNLAQLALFLTVVFIFIQNEGFSYTPQESADLISDIRQYFQAPTVFLVHSFQYQNVTQMNFMFHLLRILLRKNLTIVTKHIHQLGRSEKYYKVRIARPLIVVLLTSKESIQFFEKRVKKLDLVSPFWFIFFWLLDEKPSYDYCRHPLGNPFNTTFNSELLTKCHADDNIYEWYSIYKNKTEVRQFATWNPKNRLNLSSKKELYIRRNQLGGVTLRVGSLEAHPDCKGITTLMERLVKEISHELNFTVDSVTATKQKSLGILNLTTDSWTGLMGQLQRREVEMSISPMIMTPKRMEYVDYSHPILLSRVYIYIKRPQYFTVHWQAHFETFNSTVWFCILSLILIVPIFLTLINLKRSKLRTSFNQILHDNYFKVWGIYCQQSTAEHELSLSLRVAYFSIFISSLVIISNYSAYLRSYVSLPGPTLPFNNLDGFLADGTYKLIVVNQSEDHAIVKYSNSSIISKMNSLMEKDIQLLPTHTAEGFEQVCSKRVGLLISRANHDSLMSIPCPVVKVRTGKINCITLAFAKNSQYLGVIRYHVQRLLENGKMNRFKKQCMRILKKSPKAQYINVALQGVAPIFAIILSGLGFSLFILLLEKIYFFYNKKKESKKLPFFN